MKKLFTTILISLFFFYSCTQNSGTAQTSVKKKVIKLSHCHQADMMSEIHTAAWLFQKYIEDYSNTLTVKIYPSNALGQEREVYEAMQLGGGAACIISGTAILNNFVPEIGVLDLAFLWRDYNHVHRNLDGEVGNILANKLQPAGFHVLAWMDSWGYRNVVTAKKEINNTEDLGGLKIRTIQSPINIAALNMMGANATPMAFGEVYTGMQTGVLDGFEHNATVIKANKFYEVADQVTLTRHLFGPLVMIFSEKEWQKLTEKEQEVVQQAAKFAQDFQRSLAPIREKEALGFLKSKGMKIKDIDREPFIRKSVVLQNQLAKEYNSTDLLEMIRNN